MSNENIIIGRNPVIEALRSEREIEKIVIAKGAEGSIKKIEGMAKDKRIPIQYADKAALDRIAEGKTHQGVIAFVSTFEYCEVEDIVEVARTRGEAPFIIILLIH